MFKDSAAGRSTFRDQSVHSQENQSFKEAAAISCGTCCCQDEEDEKRRPEDGLRNGEDTGDWKEKYWHSGCASLTDGDGKI
ncbi:Serine/Threonine-Protein Kinase 17B [Manis pentadactyla]|nr:Serine/Threonine-Protein Kinase 17B [Manis pentadactyla]